MSIAFHEGWVQPLPSAKAAHHLRGARRPEPPPREPRDPALAAALAGLSRMQRLVLRCRCAGMSGAAIAEHCALSPQTVKNHLTAAYRALGVAGSICGARACYLLGRYDADHDAG